MNRLILIAVLVAACASPAQPGASPTTPSATATPAAAAPTPTAAPTSGAPTAAPPTVGPVITPPAGFQLVIGTDVSGTYLVTPDGYSLYTFDNDSPGSSACNGDCAGNWPPFQTGGVTVGGAAGVSGTFGTVTRTDGTPQITYKDSPLYFYSGDDSPGDTTGDGVGGVWHLAKP